MIFEFTDKEFMREFTLSNWKIKLEQLDSDDRIHYQIAASILIMLEVYLGIMVTVHSKGIIDPTFGSTVVLYAMASLYTLLDQTTSTLILMSVSTIMSVKMACFALIYGFVQYHQGLLSGEFSFALLTIVLIADAVYSYYRLSIQKEFTKSRKDYKLMGVKRMGFAFGNWKSSQYKNNQILVKVLSLGLICLQISFAIPSVFFFTGFEVRLRHYIFIVPFCNSCFVSLSYVTL